MDETLTKIIAELFSSSGIVAQILLLGCIWLAKQLADERKSREDERRQTHEDARQRADAWNRVADALSQLSNTVARLEGILRAPR